MTTRPKLRLGRTLVPGVVAVVLFAVMSLIVLDVPFGSSEGFPGSVSITAEIGYAMLDLTALQSTEGAVGATEPFLVAFLLAAVVLDAALDASLVLAKREEEGEAVTALRATRDADEAAAAAADGGVSSAAGSDGDDSTVASSDGGKPAAEGSESGPSSADDSTGGDWR